MRLKPIKIKLDESDFQCLVSGGVLTVRDDNQQVEIILADIGFHRMDHCIYNVEIGKVKPYSHKERRND